MDRWQTLRELSDEESEPVPSLKRSRNAGESAFGLLAGLGALCCLVTIVVTAVSARPVNDDYIALGSQWDRGFFGSLAWYYSDFQGNVASWLFILLHEQQWYSGVTVLGGAASIAATLLLIATAAWGAVTFLGMTVPKGIYGLSFWLIATTVIWLSLASLVAPSTMTAALYVPSAIVHIWPWALAMTALGFLFRRSSRGDPATTGLLFILGLLAGALGLTEGLLIAAATVVVGIGCRISSSLVVRGKHGSAWIAGLAIGLLVQVAAPATWQRGEGVGSSEALLTNLQAVDRLLDALRGAAGEGAATFVLAIANEEVWARVLVPVAIVGDLLLRPGLVAVIALAGWWALTCGPGVLPRGDLRVRLVTMLAVTVVAAIGYAVTGALYAYSSRHATGLALLVAALAAGWSWYLRDWWSGRRGILVAASVLGIVILIGLAAQQVTGALWRATEWDRALAVNRELLENGSDQPLVEVEFRGGVSSSGLRDHEGGPTYPRWIQTWR